MAFILSSAAAGAEPGDSAWIIPQEPAAVENFFNIYVSASVEVPRGCCVTVSARNTSTQTVDFANSNMEVVRTA